MAARRLSEPDQTVTLWVDGEAVTAAAGEPVAVALAASERLLLGRSIKYHRPRGGTCFNGRCDGCLMRIDGMPNVMSCRTSARQGMVVETQNVVGTVKTDLLAVTDWFFPKGMDHHHMFTKFRPVNQVMQKVARRVAGIGRIPENPVPPAAVRDIESDVLVIGGGPAGLALAAECADGGLETWLVDEEEEVGGHLRYYPGGIDAGPTDGSGDGRAIAKRLARSAADRNAKILTNHGAMGVYTDPPRPIVGIDGHDGLIRARTKRLVIATGSHEGSVAVPGSDLPGVIGIRAACRLLMHQVLVGREVALVGEGVWVSNLAGLFEEAGADVVGPFAFEALEAIVGRQRVTAIDVRQDGKRKKHRCDALVVAAPLSGAFELAGQAGIPVVFRNGRFEVDASSADGSTEVPWASAVGECTGTLELPEMLMQARSAGRRLVQEVRDGR